MGFASSSWTPTIASRFLNSLDKNGFVNQTSEDSVPEYFAAMRASAFHAFSSSIMASVVVNSVLDSNVSKTLCVCIQMFW